MKILKKTAVALISGLLIGSAFVPPRAAKPKIRPGRRHSSASGVRLSSRLVLRARTSRTARRRIFTHRMT